MAMAFIENYRGWDISFDPDKESFIVYSSYYDEEQREKKSYPACKKYIDDFIKSNEHFKPFRVRMPQSMFSDEKCLTLLGIRKDGRFTYENEKGKQQLSEYSEKDYYIDEAWMGEVDKKVDDIDKKIEVLEKEKKQLMKDEFYSRATPLVKYKKETLGINN